MKFNNLGDIVKCLKEWDRIRDNSSEVVTYLGLGNHFTFKRNSSDASNLHVYPGICASDKELYMFLIDAKADQDTSETDLFNNITICKVTQNISNSDEIPLAEALKRISAWKKEYSSWAIDQINNRKVTQGIFRAFNMPSSHIEKNIEYSSFFALKEQGGSNKGYTADLVTIDNSKSSITYYDTVRPVPPFDIAPLSNFYLLNLL